MKGQTNHWILPTSRSKYGVWTGSEILSKPFNYKTEGYALAGYVFDEMHRPVVDSVVKYSSFSVTTNTKGGFVLFVNKYKPVAEAGKETSIQISNDKEGYWQNNTSQQINIFRTTETQIMLRNQMITNRLDAKKDV